jgi:hypothetical protein
VKSRGELKELINTDQIDSFEKIYILECLNRYKLNKKTKKKLELQKKYYINKIDPSTSTTQG